MITYLIYANGTLYAMNTSSSNTLAAIFESVKRMYKPGVFLQVVDAYTLESFEGRA